VTPLGHRGYQRGDNITSLLPSVNYPATLAELWAAHQAPKAENAPTCVSLFSGCGGTSLGLSSAGYNELLACEWDHKAARVFVCNLPGVRMFEGDICELSPDVLDLEPGELDLLAASPPCQGVSVSGLRRPADPRNELWREVVRLAAEWQPRFVVLENVKGLTIGGMKPIFKAIVGGLSDIGYRVESRLLDCQYLGIPQRRQRVIVIGVRTPLDVPQSNADALPVFPVPTTRPLTVRDAWEGLDDPGKYLIPTGAAARLAPLVEPGRTGEHALVQRGGRAVRFSLKRLHWDRPSPTIVRTSRSSGGQFLHPSEPRAIGINEVSRLMSFPDAWSWLDDTSYEEVHHLAGNAVPPILAREIGRALLQPQPGREV
jgi:DNA (cytosine-5)-methyltransferase 1